MWEHFSHDADMGVRGVGGTIAEAFTEAACALVALTTDLPDVAPTEGVEVEVTAPDEEQLLVEWLDALVFEMATRHMVFGRFEVEIDGEKLRGVAWGEKRAPGRHSEGVEVKGATFTELRVAKHDDGTWVAQCVVDV